MSDAKEAHFWQQKQGTDVIVRIDTEEEQSHQIRLSIAQGKEFLL